MAILEERGLFWWGDEAVPARQFAPDSSVPGLLKIDDDGRTSLELDGFLPNKHGPMAAMVRADISESKTIHGILKGSGKRVFLIGLITSGGRFTSNGISYERYSAMNCLVADGPFPNAKKELRFRELEVPLHGFEGWLRLSAVKVARSKRMISAKYKKPKDAVYSVMGGRLSLKFNVAGNTSATPFGDEFSVKEMASLSLRFKSLPTLDYIKTQYGLIEDLLILLTDSDYCMDWPWLSINKNFRCRLYFLRLRSKEGDTPPKFFECCTNFVQLRNEFGSIWSNWKEMREAFGPGVYLYLGTRRGIKLYVEHRFVNLIWGIEAFHRKKKPATPADALVQKIDRIIGQVQLKKDKDWLAKKLANAHEPSLGERIFDVFVALPLDIDHSRLRSFADACAQKRNDISHYGGEHRGAAYSDFVKDLANKNAALSTLYHALLLHEIGVSAKIIKSWMYEGFTSHQHKHYFVQVGLLDKSSLDAKP